MELEDKKAEILAPSQAMEEAGKLKQEDADAATKEADEYLSHVDEMQEQIAGDLEKRKIVPKVQLDAGDIADDSELGKSIADFNNAIGDAIATAASDSGEEAIATADAKVAEMADKLIAQCDATIKAATIKIGELAAESEKLDALLEDDSFGQGAKKGEWSADNARYQAAEAVGMKQGADEDLAAY